MRFIAGAVLLFFLVLAAASVVLLATWLLSLPIQHLLGLTQFQAGILAVGALLIVLAGVVIMGWRSPWEMPWADTDTEDDEVELEANEPEQDGPEWFQPCPCDSKKVFARCCGRKAFKARGSQP